MPEPDMEVDDRVIKCDRPLCSNLIHAPRPYKLRVRENNPDGISAGYYYFCSQDCINSWSI